MNKQVKVTANVTVVLEVQLLQPWSEEATMAEVHGSALRAAMDVVMATLQSEDARRIRAGCSVRMGAEPGAVRIITEEG